MGEKHHNHNVFLNISAIGLDSLDLGPKEDEIKCV